jgi:hypothetical protein
MARSARAKSTGVTGNQILVATKIANLNAPVLESSFLILTSIVTAASRPNHPSVPVRTASEERNATTNEFWDTLVDKSNP